MKDKAISDLINKYRFMASKSDIFEVRQVMEFKDELVDCIFLLNNDHLALNREIDEKYCVEIRNIRNLDYVTHFPTTLGELCSFTKF